MTVGSGPSPAPGGDAIQTSIGPPAPGAWIERIPGWRTPRCQADPIPVRVRRRPRSAVITSGARPARVPTTTTRSPPDEIARWSQAASATASGPGSAVPRPVAESIGKSHGTHRPRSETRAIRPSLPAQNGPPREVTCQPWRSVSSHEPTGPIELGRERDRRPGAVGRRDHDSRAEVVERIRFHDPDRGQPASIGRDRGVAGRAAQAQDLDRLAAADADPPDRRSRSQVGGRAPVGGEDERPSVRVPAGPGDTPIPPGQAPGARPAAPPRRRGAPSGRDDPRRHSASRPG